jgi:PAS domain S-box-containing protein
MTEVTQRKPADRYRDLFEHLPIGLYATGPGGQILEANPALVAMLGYPDRESLLRTNVKDIYVRPEDYRSQHALLDQDGIVRGYEMQLRRNDGEEIWVKDSFRAVKDGDGNILYFEGSLEDITAHKGAREALQRSEQLFRSLFENASDAIFLMGNQQAADMLGYARDGYWPHLHLPFTSTKNHSQTKVVRE